MAFSDRSHLQGPRSSVHVSICSASLHPLQLQAPSGVVRHIHFAVLPGGLSKRTANLSSGTPSHTLPRHFTSLPRSDCAFISTVKLDSKTAITVKTPVLLITKRTLYCGVRSR